MHIRRTKLSLALQNLFIITLVAVLSVVTTYVLIRDQIIQGFEATHQQLVADQVIAEGHRNVAAEVFRAHEIQTIRQLLNQGWMVMGLTLLIAGVMAYYLAAQAIEPIQKTYEAQANFIADASHELKTPLTGLMTRTEVALLKKQITESELKAVLKKNLASIKHLHQLIIHLLELTRIEMGQLELNLGTVDLVEMVEEIIEDVQARYPDKNIDLKQKVQVKHVRSDTTYLRQLLTVLIDNAYKYSPAQGWVMVEVVTKGKVLEIRVTDSGPGIEKARIPHIYQRFYRASSDNASESFGLGLPLAAKLVKAFGGTIGVYSVVGQGSTFTVRLPQT